MQGGNLVFESLFLSKFTSILSKALERSNIAQCTSELFPIYEYKVSFRIAIVLKQLDPLTNPNWFRFTGKQLVTGGNWQ